MNQVKEIVSDIKNGHVKPIYFLMGDEPYYIDKISDYIEENVLSEAEKGFNQVVLYGRDVDTAQVISECKRYPMMSERTVVIIKEAQDLSRTIENLAPYVEQMQPSTVLVIQYKYKKLDKRKKLSKLIAKHGVLFESKKLYDNQVQDWIPRVLASHKLKIEPKAAYMLVEFLGTELSKIANELDKLALILPEGSIIEPHHIEENIGISKDFNTFELRKALGQKNVLKVNRIAQYFSENPKNHPLILTLTSLQSYFTQLLKYHGLKDKSKANVAKKLGVNIYFVDDYAIAARNYPMRKVSAIIAYLRQADLQAKGVGSSGVNPGDLLKELLFKIMH
ncbi:MAG: DNA polymerase III subunit delta [Flavobacteriaceae bacterium]